MKKLLSLVFILSVLISGTVEVQAQKKKKSKDKKEEVKDPLDELSIPGLKFRCIGPANTSGRISDFAFNPSNPFEYYVATSAGGVWKTVNSEIVIL